MLIGGSDLMMDAQSGLKTREAKRWEFTSVASESESGKPAFVGR
jgi:hypothetical protein